MSDARAVVHPTERACVASLCDISCLVGAPPLRSVTARIRRTSYVVILQLKPSKTRVCHTLKPSKNAQKRHVRMTQRLIRGDRRVPQSG